MHYLLELYPKDIAHLIMTFLSIKDLVGLRENYFCQKRTWEFYMRKPIPVFRKMVWQNRTKGSMRGVSLYAYKVLENEFQISGSAKETHVLESIFKETFHIDGHESCSSGMKKLILNNHPVLSDGERNFLQDHFVRYFVPVAWSIMQQSTRRNWQMHGFGSVFSKIVHGLITHPKFSDEFRLKIVKFLISNDKVCDRVMLCYPREGVKIAKFTQGRKMLKEMGTLLIGHVLSLRMIPPNLQIVFRQQYSSSGGFS